MLERRLQTEELLGLLHNRRIIIYGAGYVAKKFYYAMKKHGMSSHVISFVTTDDMSGEVEGVPLLTIDGINKQEDDIVCIAVHESLKDEVIQNLESKGIRNYVWIYPNLYELILGNPKRNVLVPIKVLVEEYQDVYQLAARWLAIENYYKKNDYGYGIYIRILMKYIRKDTAKKRLVQFIRLIESWERNGFEEGNSISVLKNFQIFDGVHRACVAAWFNEENIKCDIYPVNMDLRDMHKEMVIHEKKDLFDMGFDGREIEIMEEIVKRIKEQYSSKK